MIGRIADVGLRLKCARISCRRIARFTVVAAVAFVATGIIPAQAFWASMADSPDPNSGNFTVSWSNPSSKTYALQRMIAGGGWTHVANTSGSSRSFTSHAAGVYSFRLRLVELQCLGWPEPECYNVTTYSETTTTTVNAAPPGTPSSITGPSTDYNGAYSLSWGSVSGASTYKLRRKLNSGSWSTIQNTSSTSRSESGLSTGTYSYKVRACNSGGCSSYTSIKSVTVTLPPSTPSAITGPSTDNNGAYTVSWGSSSGATSYELQGQLNGGAWSLVQNTSSISRSEFELGNGTYGYRVRACNVAGCSGYTSTKTVTVTLPPAEPFWASMADSPDPNTGSFTVTWSNPSSKTYTLQEFPAGGSWSDIYTTTGTSKSFTGHAAGLYSYRVKLTEVQCLGWPEPECYNVTVYSETTTTTVNDPPPGVPAAISGPSTDYDGAYSLSWGSVTTATSYELQRQLNGGSWSLIQSTSSTSRAESGLGNGTYGYRVRACNSIGCGGYTSTKAVTVEVAPTTPAGLTGPATDPDGSYTISWNASSGSTSYSLEEQLGAGSWSEIYSGSALSKSITGNATGIYTYRVKGCNVESVCSGWSATHVVDVSSAPPAPATPPAPGPNVDPGQASSAESDSIGSIAGNFRVDESGAATYSIPIAAAAGTAGVAPQISLNYSSSVGNGIAGRGWSVGGLSAISRCRQTVGQDRNVDALTWTNSDRFCLDGQRLLVTPGQTYGAANSTYRSEIDSGVIVTAIGSTNGEPDYFEAKRKDGSTSYYGKSPSSTDTSAKLTNGAGNTLTWIIRHFKDSVGNPIWFEYDTVAGAQRISGIKYAFGANAGPTTGYGARIQFTYESRLDQISGYVAGYFFENDQRLAGIKSYNTTSSESLIREYALKYNEGISVTNDDLSRLTSIEECIGATCLPKTTFDWRVPVNSTSIGLIASMSMGSSYSTFAPADINGDGLMDLVWLEGSGSQKTMKYAFSTGTSYGNQTFSNGSLGLTVTSSASEPKLQAIDYNLDGRQDVAYFDDTAGLWKIVLSEPFGSGGWRLNTSVRSTPITTKFVSFVDVDSNGTTDALYVFGTVSTSLALRRLELDPAEADSSSHRYHFGAEGTAWSTNIDITEIASAAPDFDGDGQVDAVIHGVNFLCHEPGFECIETVRTLGAYPSHDFVSSYGDVQIEDFETVDINADGLSDAFYLVNFDSTANPREYALQINRGNGAFDYARVTDSSLIDDIAHPRFVDWNMDGFPDLLWKDKSSTGSIKVRYWNPDTKDLDPAVIVSTTASTSTLESVVYLDANGDAAPDLVKINTAGTIGSVTVVTRKVGATVANVAVNRIESITNGLGATTQITYEPLSYSDHYDRLEVATVPGTQTVCENLGVPGEEFCWEEQVQVADPGSFYTAINGDWELPVGAQTLGKNSPVIEMSGPMYVVTDVVGDAPAAGATPGTVNVNATSSISYYYSEAKIQAAGRGFLGFQRLKTIDNQSGIETTTRYRQDWPFIGRPIFTEVLSTAGHTLSQTTTDWEIVEWLSTFPTTATSSGTAALDALHVMGSYSGEQSYDLVSAGAAQGALLGTVSTGTTYDTEGNATEIVVTIKDGIGATVKIVDTDNTYLNNGSFSLFEGRLSSSDVTTTYYGTVAPVRKSTFDYYTSGTSRGLLWHETTEPNNSAYTLVTTHSHDAFGNRVRSSTTGGTETHCNADTTAYDSRGRYVDTTFDCLGRKLTEVAARNSFGSPTTIKAYTNLNGIDYVTSTFSYSVLGREYYRYQSNGSYATKYLTLDLSYCPNGTAYKATASDGSGAASHDCFDVLARSIRTMTKGFDGLWNAQDTEYDQFGRVKRKSEPFDLTSGSQVAPYWSTLSYDLLGRVTLSNLPDGSSGSSSYSGLTTVTTNDAGQTRTEVKNVLGEVTVVTDNLSGQTQFSYDHQGNMTSMVDPANNTTSIVYDLLGRKTDTYDPDKGHWTYSYNYFGELTLQTDAKGQTQTVTYDGLRRMATRVDKDSIGTITGSSSWTYDTAAYGLGQLDNVTDTMSGYMRAVLYDSLGRADEAITNFDGGIYYEKTTFDQIGRVFQVFDAAGDGSYTDFGIVNGYNAYGHLASISDAVLVNGLPRTVYRKVIAMNARRQVTSEQRGIDNQVASPQPSVTTSYVYSSTTGRLLSIDGINASGLDVQDLDYSWDTLGNLSSRQEMSGNKNLSESFSYDGLNRLSTQTVSGQSSITISYDAIGNITNKSDVGSYTYGAGSAGPHAVTGAGGAVYSYDLNGSNTSGDGRTIQYTTFDKPDQIIKSGHTTTFAYGPDRSRYRRIDTGSSGTTTTRSIGNVEIIFQANGDQDRKRYIAGIAVETVHFGSDSIEDYRETHYLHKDHLGSLDVITDSTGAIVQELSFDAWGQRRDAIDWTTFTPTALVTYDHSLTTRGFTGHEMLDEVGIIHMNGRIYDPKLGRFLQADPFIQDPMNTQSLNRYSYVLNNPLNATDPSGFISLKDILKIVVAIVVSVYTFGAIYSWATQVGGWATSTATIAGNTFSHLTTGGMIAAGTVAGATAGFVGGLITTGSLKGAAQAAFSGAVFGGIGGYFGNTWNLKRASANGLAGGITSKANGGEFKDGLRLSLTTSLLTLANYKMRHAMVKQSKLNPDNIGKDSEGFFDDGYGVGGTRRIVNPKYGKTPNEPKYIICDGPAGGCQGPVLAGSSDVGSRLGPFDYNSGDFLDTTVESFAGPHDWLSDQVGMYDAYGNGIYREGLEKAFYNAMSAGLIPVAAPFSLAGLIDTTHGVHNLLYYGDPD